MFKKLLMLTALPLLLAACVSAPTPSTTQSIAPTVACSENAAATALPSYPVAPVANDDVSLLTYSKEQQLWAVSAVSAYAQERAKRRATSNCLADLRQRGLIN